MVYEYGEFTTNQIAEMKKLLQKKIFFLLLIVDPNTREEYDVDVAEAFEEMLQTLSALNGLLHYPVEIVDVSCKLKAALDEYSKGPTFDFKIYRRLVLGAGKEIELIKEV